MSKLNVLTFSKINDFLWKTKQFKLFYATLLTRFHLLKVATAHTSRKRVVVGFDVGGF